MAGRTLQAKIVGFASAGPYCFTVRVFFFLATVQYTDKQITKQIFTTTIQVLDCLAMQRAVSSYLCARKSASPDFKISTGNR